MSKKVTISGFVYWKRGWDGEDEFQFHDWDLSADCLNGRVKVMPHTFTAEIPDDFDPIPGQVAAFREQEKQLDAAYSAAKMEVAAKIAKLLCIESAVQS